MTDDTLHDEWAIIRELSAGHTYQIRVITKSDLGEAVSQIHEVIAGTDPGMSRSFIRDSSLII